MAAGKYNFIVEQGTQHEVTFRYKLSDGTYQNLDNYRVRMAVKNHPTDTTYVYRASTSSSDDTDHLEHFTIASPQSNDDLGKFTLTIPSGTTTGFEFTQGVYDLEIVDGNDVVSRLLEGKFKIKPQVSE